MNLSFYLLIGEKGFIIALSKELVLDKRLLSKTVLPAEGKFQIFDSYIEAEQQLFRYIKMYRRSLKPTREIVQLDHPVTWESLYYHDPAETKSSDRNSKEIWKQFKHTIHVNLRTGDVTDEWEPL